LKLYYFQGKTASNFGDELNTWLWPQLLPNVFDDDPKALFLGIGSVLFDHFPQQQQKIVMGAGYGGYTAKPQIDEQWKIYFVRGRLTAQALGLDARLAIGDAAILLRSCAVPVVAKRYKVSFMPHWESVPRGNWVSICQRAGVSRLCSISCWPLNSSSPKRCMAPSCRMLCECRGFQCCRCASRIA
jgi:hypothetical protein